MEKYFVLCSKCKKRLIQRDENGLFYFAFGKDVNSKTPPVEMQIYGSIKMKCLRRSCGHWNVINFFPNKEDF